MTKKPKPFNFDREIKSFLRNYGIVTGQDLKKIETRLNRIEKLIKDLPRPRPKRRPARGGDSQTAWRQVLDVIPVKGGVGVAEIKEWTGFNDKKVRNIIFRLDKEGKIDRIRRGLYVASS